MTLDSTLPPRSSASRAPAPGRARGHHPPASARRGQPASAPAQPVVYRRIAVVPAYNEEPTVYDVLRRLHAHPSVDEIVIVDDGSTDRTRAEIERFLDEGHERVQLVAFDHNRGMSAAYSAAFRAIGERVQRGELAADDLILTVDADGQHDPALLDRLIQITVDEDLAALVAERDLKGSGYTRYKRVGNWLMSAWATLWAGQRWYDVESGFRIFRVGPLLDALQYYKGHRYSETVEVAVILSRLGYRVRNDILIPVPVFRSRTRLYDVAVDLAVMPMAWWRVTMGRSRPFGVSLSTAFWLPLLVYAPLALLLLLIASKRVYLGYDSINNYLRVWILKEQIFDLGAFPLHAPQLDGGQASILPYGGPPWLVAALLWVPLREWSVTWTFVLGMVALMWSATVARRAMRDPWFMLLFVLNPFFVDALLVFQYSFIWSAVFFFLYAAALDRRRWLLAGVLGALSAMTHPIMAVVPVAAYLLWSMARRRTPLGRGAALAAGMAVATLPALYLMLLTPSIEQNSAKVLILSIGDVLVRRWTVLLVPFAFALWAPLLRRHWRPFAVFVLLTLAMKVPIANGLFGIAEGGYDGVVRVSRDHYRVFAQSPAFDPGAMYRVLAPNQREDGLYYLVRHGGLLASELFTESMFKRDFTPEQYACFLRAERIDYVVVERAYFGQYPTNEGDLLHDLAHTGRAERIFAHPDGRYLVYDVRGVWETLDQPLKTVYQCLAN